VAQRMAAQQSAWLLERTGFEPPSLLTVHLQAHVSCNFILCRGRSGFWVPSLSVSPASSLERSEIELREPHLAIICVQNYGRRVLADASS